VSIFKPFFFPFFDAAAAVVVVVVVVVVFKPALLFERAPAPGNQFICFSNCNEFIGARRNFVFSSFFLSLRNFSRG